VRDTREFRRPDFQCGPAKAHIRQVATPGDLLRDAHRYSTSKPERHAPLDIHVLVLPDTLVKTFREIRSVVTVNVPTGNVRLGAGTSFQIEGAGWLRVSVE